MRTIGALAPALAAALLAVPVPAPAAVELCAALDGSYSVTMDPARFALQLEGLARSVEDPMIVAREGSVALSAVVFGREAAVEVPAAVISSASA